MASRMRASPMQLRKVSCWPAKAAMARSSRVEEERTEKDCAGEKSERAARTSDSREEGRGSLARSARKVEASEARAAGSLVESWDKREKGSGAREMNSRNAWARRMKPGGTGKLAWVRRARLAPLPPDSASCMARGSRKRRMFVINRPRKLENGNSKIEEKKNNAETQRTQRGRRAAKAKHGITALNH